MSEQRRPLHFLVVHGDESLLGMYRQNIERAGHRCTATSDTDSAVRILSNHQADPVDGILLGEKAFGREVYDIIRHQHEQPGLAPVPVIMHVSDVSTANHRLTELGQEIREQGLEWRPPQVLQLGTIFARDALGSLYTQAATASHPASRPQASPLPPPGSTNG